MRIRHALAAATLACATAAGCSSKPDTFHLRGTITLNDTSSITWDYNTDPPPCWGAGGYNDIAAGTPVVVADQAGTTIATGQLAAGVRTAAHTCALPFDVTVPAGKTFYAVTVSHRGSQTYNADQAKAGIALTLG